MICLVVDNHVVAIGSDFMEHIFLQAAAECFPDKEYSILTEAKE